MSEWKEYRFSDVIEIIGGGTPKTSNPEYWNGKIPWLSVADFNTGRKYVSSAEKKITEKGLNESNTKLLNFGDIIISARGTVGVVAVLAKPMAFNQSCYGVRAIESLTNTDYVYYLLKDTVADFRQIAHGGVFDTITRDTFNEIEILLPSLPEQKSIASVLSSLDDKIDLLHRQNATLEKMAETLFRQWLAEPIKKILNEGAVVEGFSNAKFEKWIKETVGGEWGKENSKGDYNKIVYCIRGTDIADLNNGLPEKAPIRFVKESKFERIEPHEGDLILEISGGTESQSTGRVCYINQDVKSLFKNPVIFSNFCRMIRVKKSEYSFFLYCYFQYLYTQDEFFNLENGTSGIKNLDYKALLFELDYPMPGEELVLDFNKQVEPYFKKINQNKSQIQTLTALRDTLLPKLMSGEVTIKM
ncbi:MAG: restriction endonuclease subunit S [Bacteroidota bacterium]|jgi:type I restriction enzyme S subunit|nr:restriction endonuclease subunit S [Bacteroidota bacterium]